MPWAGREAAEPLVHPLIPFAASASGALCVGPSAGHGARGLQVPGQKLGP